jgi:hypothetical protein
MIDLPPDDPPEEELTKEQLHDRWESATNLSASQLRRFEDSQFNDAYKEQNSEQAQGGDEPLADAIMLASTPADEWGETEREEAEEALNWIDRHGAQLNSQGLGDNFLTDEKTMQKREAAFIRWGVDPDDEIEW